ncbi:MAG TPA: hypothetical protein VGN93_01575 [Shinella sp.]|jgi:hypothetical protein|uniref:hypothetical protein n=1 Tax=Shinella sp. TaxID=1870904 RepID=UPI002E0D890D|nr:hypothetical protein [Shinella sp.]
MGTEKQAASAGLLRLSIDRFYHGKWWKDFQPWRLALADMVGATVVYRVHAAPFRATRTVPDYRMPERLDVLRADSIGGAHAMAITDSMRAGQWPETPDEPLLVLLLISLPGCALPARHAAAVAERLVDLDELIHALDDGRYTVSSLTDMHEAAMTFFRWQAQAGEDVPVHGLYGDGWTDFDTKTMGAVAL